MWRRRRPPEAKSPQVSENFTRPLSTVADAHMAAQRSHPMVLSSAPGDRTYALIDARDDRG
jgi:hypothetical protein